MTSPFDKPELECKNCGNPIGRPWHSHRGGYCMFQKTPERRNQDRAEIIRYLETDGTFLERLWLPVIRWVHRRCTR